MQAIMPNFLKPSAMLFNDSRHSRIYHLMMAAAQQRPSPNCYTERHHIIPKALGGTNDKSNLVILTAREHFIAHKLLVKMTSGKHKYKMISALWAMCNLKSKYHARPNVSSRDYEHARMLYKEKVKLQLTGIKKTEEHKTKIGAKHRGKIVSQETRLKIAIAKIGKPGNKHTDEQKLAASARVIGDGNPAARRCKFMEKIYGNVKAAALENNMTIWKTKNHETFFFIDDNNNRLPTPKYVPVKRIISEKQKAVQSSKMKGRPSTGTARKVEVRGAVYASQAIAHKSLGISSYMLRKEPTFRFL